MNRKGTLGVLGLGLMLGATGGYLLALGPSDVAAVFSAFQTTAPAAERKVLYYRDPGGAPYWSAGPKKDSAGRDFLPVYEEEEPSLAPAPKEADNAKAAHGERKVLYYRNPMGLPDTSPVPKKDPMGMDYIPVFADENDEPGTVKVSLDKVQRIGVRTAKAELRPIVQDIRAVGKIEHDETRLTSVTLRTDGFIEDLIVNKTGQHVMEGEPLFRLYSPQIQLAQSDLIVAMRAVGRMTGSESDKNLEGAMLRLRNLGVPQSRIDEVRKTGTNPRTIDWPSPASGDVIVKNVINGQRVLAGDELYRIADHSHVWVIADVAEGNAGSLKIGGQATVTLRSDPEHPVQGTVTFIYPELNEQTRTIPVRIEIPNPEGRLRTSMYADVVFQDGSGDMSTIVVPSDAVIDSGTRQVVLVAKGDGRFEPRDVKLGRRGRGLVEITGGLKAEEEIVISANFLLDAESNLKAALQTFSQQEPQP